MSNRKLALAILALLFSVATPLSVVDLVNANYYPPPSIEIFSPISAPKVYDESSVQLYVRVNALPSESSSITYICYCLDGKANITLTDLSREDSLYYWTSTKGVIATGNGFSINTTMDNLAEGKHTLTLYSHAADGKEMSRTTEFTVDYDYVPPQNPFGLPNNLPKGTATIPPTTVQTETPTLSAETDSFQPLENPLLFIIITCVAVSLLGAGLYFRKKSGNFMKLKGKEQIP